MYDYIRRTYRVDPIVGSRVTHQVTGKAGVIVRPQGDPQYVQVRFDGVRHTLPCHPTELIYEGTRQTKEAG